MRWENSMTGQGIKRKLSDKDLHLTIDSKKSKVTHKETNMAHLLLTRMPYHLLHLVMKVKTCQVVIQDPEDLEVVDTFIVMGEIMMIMNLKANMTTKANMITKESMTEKATATEERTLKDMKANTTEAIMVKMISTELSITSSTSYTQSNSLT